MERQHRGFDARQKVVVERPIFGPIHGELGTQPLPMLAALVTGGMLQLSQLAWPRAGEDLLDPLRIAVH